MKNHFKLSLLFLVCVHRSILPAAAVNLTPENWDEVTAGKSVFVKFFASWCGHCKKMKPVWDDLMKKHQDSPSFVIGDVECSANDANQAFCKQYQVKGYPTLLYGDPAGTLEKYSGKRDLGALEEFVQSNLKPLCSVANRDACSKEQIALLEEYQQMNVQDLEQKIQQTATELKSAEQDYTATVKRMEDEFRQYQSEQSTSLGLMKSVVKAKGSSTTGNQEL